MTKVFTTSDTHFYHANIIKYCDRKYETVEDMNEGIITIWNDTVGEKDTIYHLGDFAFTGIGKIKDLLARLNGQINIIPGNHDHNIAKMKRRGDELPPGIVIKPQYYRKKIGHRWFIMCHFPFESWEGMTGHSSDGIDGSIHVHGHLHGNMERIMTDRFDVGWDVYGKPVDITDGTLQYLLEGLPY